jgi:hypothetical protein
MQFRIGERAAIAALLDELQRGRTVDQPTAAKAGQPDGQPV